MAAYMSEDAPTPTPQECYEFLCSERYSKRAWLNTFSFGQKKRPDHEIAQKRKALAMYEFMCGAYEKRGLSA
jgi:hypothetical protein